MGLIKETVRDMARRFGYQIVKWRPNPTLDSIGLVLGRYLEVRPDAVFVQVGACDGVTGDPVHEFIRRGILRSVLIEPIPRNFRELQATYAGVPNVSLLQAAIGMSEGTTAIYSVKNEGSWENSKWAKQWASFDKRRLMRKVKKSEIEESIVPTVTLASIQRQFSLPQIDILQIDTEGFDGQVVEMALNLPTLPECIGFEFIHIPRHEFSVVMKRLHEHGYFWTYDNWNALAVHERLIGEWTRPKDHAEAPSAEEEACR